MQYPGQTNEANPEKFNLEAMPPQPVTSKPGQLTPEQVKQFFTQGYVVVENYFQETELQPVRNDLSELVDDLAQTLYKAGKIKNLYEDEGLFRRQTLMNKEFPGANILFLKRGILPQSIRDLWSNDRLLNAVEQIIGPDITGHPVWNIRCKTPKNTATTVPWHQDAGYLDNRSYKVMQLTAWIPLIDANEKNGCLQIARRGHKTGRVATHTCCYDDTWYVMLDEEEMEKHLGVNCKEDLLTVPVRSGGMILFNNIIPHRSLSNTSDDIRWSLDLRWQKTKEEIGFYDLKDGVVMRVAGKTDHVIDWENFCKVDRTAVQSEACNHQESEFDLTIHGPWMKKWEITNHNVHTRAAAAN